MGRGGSTSTTRIGGQDGSVIIEFALVLPMLIMLVLGIIEFGTIFRDKTLISGGVRAAARVESQSGNSGNPNPSADLYALSSLASTAAAVKNATLLKVVIYKSTSATGGVPSACLSAATTNTGPNGVAGVCNVYTPAQVAAVIADTAASSFGCTTMSTWDHQWCVSSRDATLAGADWIGVWVQYQYLNLTSLVPDSTMKLTDNCVFRTEPAV